MKKKNNYKKLIQIPKIKANSGYSKKEKVSNKN